MKKLLTKPGFILLLLSVIGFIYTTTLKKQKQVFFKKYYNQDVNKGFIDVEQGEKYTFAFSTTDEESGGFAQWPYAEAYISIVDDKNVILLEDTIAHGGFEDVGLKRAMDYEEYEIIINKESKIIYKSRLIQGDECELIIYKNMEDWRNILPGLFLITFMVGLFWLLRKKQK